MSKYFDISFCSDTKCNRKDCPKNFIHRPRKGNRLYVVADYNKDKKFCLRLKGLQNETV